MMRQKIIIQFAIACLLLARGPAPADTLVIPACKITAEYDGKSDMRTGFRDMVAAEARLTGRYQVTTVASVSEVYATAQSQPIEMINAIRIANITINRYNLKLQATTLQGVGGFEKFGFSVSANTQVVDITPGRELASFTTERRKSDEELGFTLTSGVGATGDYKTYINDLFNMNYSDIRFQKTVIYQTMRRMANKIAAGIHFHLLGKAFGLKADVVEIRGDDIYINSGYLDNVQDGDTAVIYSAGRDIKDPEDGRVIGRTGVRRIGIMRIDRVEANDLSFGTIIEGKFDVKQNDYVIFE